MDRPLATFYKQFYSSTLPLMFVVKIFEMLIMKNTS